MPNESYMLLTIKAEMAEGDDWAEAIKRFVAIEEIVQSTLTNNGFTVIEFERKRKSRRVSAKAGPQA